MSVTLLNPYTTLDDVKEYCGYKKTDEDERIKNSINKMSRMIDDLTGRFFYKKTYTDYYMPVQAGGEGWRILPRPYDRSTGGIILTPKLAPIISVTSIHESDTLLVANTDYYINAEFGQIERVGTWNANPRKIKITCVIGYTTADTETPSADLPGDIAQYAMEIAARISGQYKKEQPNLDGTVVSINSHAIPKWIVDALRKLRPVYL